MTDLFSQENQTDGTTPDPTRARIEQLNAQAKEESKADIEAMIQTCPRDVWEEIRRELAAAEIPALRRHRDHGYIKTTKGTRP